MYLKIIFTLTNSVDTDEMQHFVALYLGLRCLSKYLFKSQWFNIHVQVSIVAQDGKASRKALSDKIKLIILDWLNRYTLAVLFRNFPWVLVERNKTLTYLAKPCLNLPIHYAIYCWCTVPLQIRSKP